MSDDLGVEIGDIPFARPAAQTEVRGKVGEQQVARSRRGIAGLEDVVEGEPKRVHRAQVVDVARRAEAQRWQIGGE